MQAQTLEIEGEKYLYRGLKAWSDLAELLHCKMLVPKRRSIPLHYTHLQKAQNTKLFHLDNTENKEENTVLLQAFLRSIKWKNRLFITTTIRH